MKTVTTAFKEAQKSPVAVSVRRVSYKRRYWVESSHAYTWESSWTALPENEIVSVSPITGKLDTDKPNEFKISNVNLVLKNERRQWKAGKRGGYFGATTAYPDGFEPYWTKFKIESGYEVSGVATYVPLFVGVATGFSTAASSDTIQVETQGLEALLINANAENVSTLVALENMGSGNGSNKDFTTVHPGVGIINKVYLDGAEKKQGTDFTISQTDDPTLGAKITFTTAPSSGVSVFSTYRYWKQNSTVASLVSDLLTEAGIAPSIQNISQVVFGNVFPLNETNSFSDWALSTKTDTTTTIETDRLMIDASSGTFFNSLDTFSGALSGQWSGNPSPPNIAIVSGQLAISLNNGTAGNYFGYCQYEVSDRRFGPWEFKITLSHTNITYSVKIDNLTIEYNGYSFVQSGVISPSFSWTADTSQHTIKIIYNTNNTYSFYFDGTLRFSSSSYNFGSTRQLQLKGYSTSSSRTISIDDLKGPLDFIQGSAITKTFDLASDPASYGVISWDGSAEAGTISFESSSSTDGMAWDSWISVDGGGNIKSTPRRYIRFRVTLSVYPYFNAYIKSFSFFYMATSTFIKLAKFTDKTVYDAIQALGLFSNYEWGFKEDETFFFRSKDVNKTIDETLDSSRNLVDLSSMEFGYSNVYNEVGAEYGAYSVSVYAPEAQKASPIKRFGRKKYSVGDSDILIRDDADIASGIASGLLNRLSKLRRTCKVRTKLMEWLDLSDTVSLTFNDNIPARSWFFGDTSASFGDTTLYYFGDADQTAKNMLCKVVGYRHDTENKISEFDLEEIL